MWENWIRHPVPELSESLVLGGYRAKNPGAWQIEERACTTMTQSLTERNLPRADYATLSNVSNKASCQCPCGPGGNKKSQKPTSFRGYII